MKTLIMLMGLLTAQNLFAGDIDNSSKSRSQLPQLINKLDLRHLYSREVGNIYVKFEVNKAGKVKNPIILDTFNTKHNSTVLDAVNKLNFSPALQNGIPVKVKYFLPIRVL